MFRLSGPWVVNLVGQGQRYQSDHMVSFEALSLPAEAADPAVELGGHMHVAVERFLDYEFPPKLSSLEGDPPPIRSLFIGGLDPQSITWVPAATLAEREAGEPIFPEHPEPRDWLQGVPAERGGVLPVLAAVAEYPMYLESLFDLSPDVSPIGEYKLWLYNFWLHEWQHVFVDDFIPCIFSEAEESYTPWSVGCSSELWALVLEKALAKLCGSYEALLQSEPGPILMALTGQEAGVSRWGREGSWWARWRFLPPERGAPHHLSPQGTARRVRNARPLRTLVDRMAGTWHRSEELFAAMRELHNDNALLFAYMEPGFREFSSDRQPATPLANGLVRGQGYSVLSFVPVEEEGLLLVQLRNVWGAGQRWLGAWSKGSAEWDAYPGVRRHHLRQEHRGSGRFWMSWPDFCSLFDRVEVCPMPRAVRKASYTTRAAHVKRRSRAAQRKGGLGQFLPGFFDWRCCAVERA